MKKFIFVSIGVFCILFACHGKQTHDKREYSSVSIAVDSLGVDEAMNVDGKLKEVVELERHRKTKGRKAIVLIQSPDKTTPYFWIQVGFSTSYRFEPIYNFYVSPKNGSVFFYDTMTDSIITIEDWRMSVQKKK